ncbi:hypothetical protein [Pseudoxanthomonas sp.]|uniref:hypothetical protein n=1 Tax=Pseudoxanthomonas sp. TaxID=1871049 RepID=UPI002589EBA5|nr:hypothetical protein [Pseudoxanthomonas sp.]MCR6686995.1 TniQ family protein [Pseudoxanthomonas sp.]
MAPIDRVSVGFVSVRLNDQIGMSAFGTLLHLARLNHFHGRDFRAAFGLHFHYRDDLSHLLAFSERNQSRLAAAAGISQELQGLWPVEPWQPFSGEGLWSALPWKLRACPSCLRAGYHSNLFQMPWMARCPWHRTRLISTCRKCERPLLEGFRQGLDLACCPCGTDLVNERAVLKGDPHQSERDDFLEAYLNWTAVERERTTMLWPEQHTGSGVDALAALWPVPPCLNQWRDSFAGCRPHIHMERLGRPCASSTLDQQAAKDLMRCAKSLWPEQAAMAELPAEFLPSLLSITRQIASPLPAISLTTREREALALEPVGSAASIPSRQDLMLLPVQRVANGLYLDVRVLHRAAYRVIANLSALLGLAKHEPTPATSSAHRLLLTATRRTLLRTYADGFTHVLGRYVPALYDQTRVRAGPRLPWIRIRRDPQGPQDVTIAWSTRQSWDADVKPVVR